MEKKYNEPYYIIKNPLIISNIKHIVEDPLIKIKTVIIPIRDFKLSAESRVKHKNNKGGLWNANDKVSQIQFYNNIFSKYIFYMTKYDIPTIFIDFDKMTTDKKYLYNKIKIILDEKNIDFNVFSHVYDEVSLTSKK